MANHSYSIAEDEELRTFGREQSYDTSAAVGLDDAIDPGFSRPPSRGRRFACFFFFVLFLVGGGAGVAYIIRGRSSSSKREAAPVPVPPPSQNSSTAQSSPASAPSPDSIPAPRSTNKPAVAPSTSPPAVTTPITPPVLPAAALTPAPIAPVKTYTIQVIESTPHDEMAFLQGFEYSDGYFYESTGLRGNSSLRRIEPKTGHVLQRYDYPEMKLFGEGLTLPDKNRILMLTWQAGRGFVFDQKALNRTSEWHYPGEGWGLCTDKVRNEVYMSDGSSQLRVLDPATLKEKRRVTVTLNNATVTMLNELEWVCDEVWSNVWQTSQIYRIDPASGRVKSIIDASLLPLQADRYPNMDVLNGIAADAPTNRLWLTGKKWRKVYRVNISDSSFDMTKCG